MSTLSELQYKAFLKAKKEGTLKQEENKRVTITQDMPEDLGSSSASQKKNSNLYKEENGRIVLTSEEKVYEGSYGIDPVLVRLGQIISSPTCKVNTVLINLATCVRNAMDKDLDLTTNIKKITVEINLIIDTLVEMFSKSVVKYSYVVLYLNNYTQDWSADKLRPITPGKQLYFDLIAHLYKTLTSNVSQLDNTTINTVKIGRMLDYAGQLQSILRGITTVIPQTSYTGHYCLVSHQPLDFHVLNKCPMGLLVSSHTGEVLNNKMIGFKVFGEEHIPFNLLLHGLLGDKEQIKPTVSVKARKEIKEKAFVEKWHIRDEAFIKRSLRNIGIIIN